MVQNSSTPGYSPNTNLHREVAVNDSAAVTDKALGVNFKGFEKGIIEVVPSGGANPVIDLLFWMEGAGSGGEFVEEHTPIQFTAPGADTPYSSTFDAMGRIVFAKVVSGITVGDDLVKIYMGAEKPTSV